MVKVETEKDEFLAAAWTVSSKKYTSLICMEQIRTELSGDDFSADDVAMALEKMTKSKKRGLG